MSRADRPEQAPVELIGRDDHHPARADGPQRRCAAPSLQQCSLTQDRAGTDLGDWLTVDLDLEHAVEEQVQAVAPFAC
jgi:hypothetical protein